MFAGNWIFRTAPLALAALALGAVALADPLVVKTDNGKVHGKLIGDGKVRAFQGIPYAAPPVGDLRWKSPQAAAKWKGELDATEYGHHCAQNHVFDDMIFRTQLRPPTPARKTA
jgi:para-nitrobenzyl esterase